MKRLVDIVVSLVLIVATAPVLLVVALTVRIMMGSPVLFRQQRPGLRGRPFQILKFRTMLNTPEHGGIELPDHERLTRFGRLLRGSSLDELPELFNVLRGDMSLVGPRPLLMEYLPLFTADQARRHDVRPGITGWAQVNGRNGLSWEEKFVLDVWYVDNASIALDIRILLRTIAVVFRREGVSQRGEATMTRFTGRTNG